jgi:hypothetical protein
MITTATMAALDPTMTMLVVNTLDLKRIRRLAPRGGTPGGRNA